MIAIICPATPEKGMTTRLMTIGDDRWEVDVMQHLGPFEVRIPELSREVDLDGALDVLWEADNGSADEFARALGLSPEVIARAWARHHAAAARLGARLGGAL